MGGTDRQHPKRQQRKEWQPAGAGPAPNTIDSGTVGTRPLTTQDRDAQIWRMRTQDCLSLRAIAETLHISNHTVAESLQRSLAERTQRLAGETDGWRQAQTERYAALRQALQRCILDPDASPRDVALSVQTQLRLERDLADLWGLRVQTGRDALAEAVADVVKARVKHGRDERRTGQQEQNARRDVQEKKTNRAGAFIEGHPPLRPQSVTELLDVELVDETEAAEIEASVLAKGDLVLPTEPVPKRERDLPRRHGMVVSKETRAVLEARMPVPAWMREGRKVYRKEGSDEG